MTRVARIKSNTQIYHVMLRGIDKRDLFLEKCDYLKFLYYILRAKEKSTFTLYAYCVMTNHVHLLLNPESDELGNVMRRIAVSYAMYHNNKYGRIGHLFQNRYKSEPVGDNRYFLTVLRYIHQNPIKAGIVKSIYNYPWSSYFEYIDQDTSFDITDTSFALNFFHNLQSFKDFMIAQNDDMCMEYTNKKVYTDEKLLEVISSILDVSELPLLDVNSRNMEIIKIKQITGASNRQLSRVLKINRNALDRIK